MNDTMIDREERFVIQAAGTAERAYDAKADRIADEIIDQILADDPGLAMLSVNFQDSQVWQDAARHGSSRFGRPFQMDRDCGPTGSPDFKPDRPPLRLSNMQRIAEELSARFAGEINGLLYRRGRAGCTQPAGGAGRLSVYTVRPATGSPVGEVSAVEVGTLLGQWGHPGPDGERARGDTLITIDWRAVMPCMF